MGRIFLQAISKHGRNKKVIGNRQLRMIKGKLCLSNLIAFCDEMTCSVVEGGALYALILVGLYSLIQSPIISLKPN